MDPEDKKLVVLAKATRARSSAPRGAALRDADGRTYAGATVELPSLRVSALGVCVAMALSSGSRGAGAAVLLAEDPLEPAELEAELALLRDYAGTGVPVYVGSITGQIGETHST